MDEKWIEVSSKKIVELPFINILNKIFRLPDGTVIKDYYLVEKPPSVHIAALNSQGKIILIRHYRPGPDEFTIELPAGSIENHETVEQAGRRELMEETGYKANKLEEISNFTQDTSRFVGYRCHLLIALNLKKIKREKIDRESKEIEIVEVGISEAIEMIKNGEIKDLPTIAGILLVQRHKAKVSV